MVVYLANNWKIVLALQELVLSALQPFFSAADAKRRQQAEADEQAAAAAARAGRAARLAKSKSKSRPAVASKDK